MLPVDFASDEFNKIVRLIRFVFLLRQSSGPKNVRVDCQGYENVPCHATMLVIKTLDGNNQYG